MSVGKQLNARAKIRPVAGHVDSREGQKCRMSFTCGRVAIEDPSLVEPENAKIPREKPLFDAHTLSQLTPTEVPARDIPLRVHTHP